MILMVKLLINSFVVRRVQILITFRFIFIDISCIQYLFMVSTTTASLVIFFFSLLFLFSLFYEVKGFRLYDIRFEEDMIANNFKFNFDKK